MRKLRLWDRDTTLPNNLWVRVRICTNLSFWNLYFYRLHYVALACQKAALSSTTIFHFQKFIVCHPLIYLIPQLIQFSFLLLLLLALLHWTFVMNCVTGIITLVCYWSHMLLIKDLLLVGMRSRPWNQLLSHSRFQLWPHKLFQWPRKEVFIGYVFQWL
jgi:hypothetical protein